MMFDRLIELPGLISRQMFERLSEWWRRRQDEQHAIQRNLDIQILWPAIKQQAPCLRKARIAFTIHASTDPAWRALGSDELVRRINALT